MTAEKTDIEQLTEENEWVVRTIASKYIKAVPQERRGLVSYEDLYSAGYEELLIAAPLYDPKKGVKFSTFIYNRIKGEVIRELIFYIGTDALLLSDEEIDRYRKKNAGNPDDAESSFDISMIPEEEQVKIIKTKLKETGLTDEETGVFLAVNGIGRDRVTNLSALAREMGKRELELRRISQRAQEKVKKLTS